MRDAKDDRIADLEHDNKRLRRLLDQRDAPGELRHRLRSTLSLLRSVIRNSAETGRALPDYIAHLEDRLDAIARAQAAADHHGEIDLRTLLVDELFQYGVVEGDRLTLTGQDVQFPLRTGRVLALAIHELAVNAVEHGALGMDTGRIAVSWQVNPEGTHLVLSWTECGQASEPSPTRRGFGTDVLSRMLPYELKAETEMTFGSQGLEAVLRLPMPDPAAPG